MGFGDGGTWLVIPIQIFFVDLLLGADNALLIALACRSLGPEDTRRAIFIGAAGAVVMRLALTLVATWLLALPFVKLVGAAVLVVIALNVSAEHGSNKRVEATAVRGGVDFWSAASVIVVADSAMSLDNVVALAAIARGNFWLLAAGVLLSIPVLAFGGMILSAMLRNAPKLITLGAALLGWIAGGMAISDPLVADWANANAPGLVAIAPALGAAFVFFAALLKPDAPAARTAAPVAAARREQAHVDAPARPAPTSPRVQPAAAPREARVPSPESAEPQRPYDPPPAPATRDDRVAIIGVLIFTVIAGLVLIVVSYLDSLN